MELIKRVSTQIHSRKIDRGVAHANMKRAKLRRVNKHDYHVYYSISGATIEKYEPSYFSKHWREYVDIPTIDLRRKKK